MTLYPNSHFGHRRSGFKYYSQITFQSDDAAVRRYRYHEKSYIGQDHYLVNYLIYCIYVSEEEAMKDQWASERSLYRDESEATFPDSFGPGHTHHHDYKSTSNSFGF